MAKYVLRPEKILPQVSLKDALLWIAFNTYPESFWDISSHDVDTNPLINHLNVEPDFTRKDWEKNYINKESDFYGYYSRSNNDDVDTATHRLFSSFKESKVKFCGVKATYYKSKEEYLEYLNDTYSALGENVPVSELLTADTWENKVISYEYEEINPNQIQYNDFIWEENTIQTKNILYRELILSTDDLFNIYPLELSQGKQVQLGANNYFIDDEDNNEIQISETRGRKSKLTPKEIIETILFAQTIMKENDNIMNKVLINKCVDWAFETFGIQVPTTTMRDYLNPITKKSEK